MDNHIENFLLIHFDIIKKYFNINLIIKGNVKMKLIRTWIVWN